MSSRYIILTAGFTKEFNKEISQGLKKEDKKILKDKMTHHHIENDVISQLHLTGKGTIGRVKKYKSEDASPLKKHSLENWTKEEGEEPHETIDIIGE